MKPTSQHLVLALVFFLAFLSVLILYTVRHQVLENFLDGIAPSSLTSQNILRPPVTAPKAQWDPIKKYLVYLPFEGISNQFYSLQNAATIAKRLNRTLVVAPITSNRHDRLNTNQPWSRYLDLEHMALRSGIQLTEWHTLKQIDPISHQIINTGSRTSIPQAWRAMAEPMPCQVIRNYGHDYFVGEEDSIGADFAYQYLLDLQPMPVPGFSTTDSVAFVDDILDHNQNSTENIVCLTFTFTAQFEQGRNRWDVSWDEAGQYLRFLPRFASYVEDLVAFRFGQLEDHLHPRPPLDLGFSILDKGPAAETFLSRKPPLKDYIAIHLRRGDIEIKCQNQAKSDCTIPISVYKAQVDAILADLDKNVEPPNVVLVSDTQSKEEKKEIDGYGWYRLDHAVDPNLLDASRVLGPFSPPMIDAAVLTGRGARWVIGSRRSTMSWLTAMRINAWHNGTIIYPKVTEPQTTQDHDQHNSSTKTNTGSRKRYLRHNNNDGDGIVIWDRYEQHYFDLLELPPVS
ncbi:hypothetical protein BG011_004345 [Mortierella polycephala]|uniref:Uncharacterized protein n=1 Tax=Mortierella polycephala TaxID=41804 RepID=A0A9P6U1Q6_9FUNG|nr:hypothetical protein BG011_004345 [Mortierella polycephala]